MSNFIEFFCCMQLVILAQGRRKLFMSGQAKLITSEH